MGKLYITHYPTLMSQVKINRLVVIVLCILIEEAFAAFGKLWESKIPTLVIDGDYDTSKDEVPSYSYFISRNYYTTF